MDVTFSNVLEGTRQYFMGVPKQAQTETSGQTMWPATAVPTEEGAPAKSGAPAPTSRPPSAAAAPPTTPGAIVAVATVPPPRPPSEPLEPEPHIIHKATVMREAAEKRREQPEMEDDEEHNGALSPPSHIIRKPTPHTMPSPAPAPAAPCPSPARPPSELQLSQQPSLETQQDPSIRHVQTPTLRPPDHYNQGRLDPYTASRPPEPYPSYHYDTNLPGSHSRSSHRQPVASPQPSVPPRHSPLTYLRMTGSMPQQTVSRLRDLPAHSPPAQRHVITLPQPLPPHNDRVPPIHHPPMIQPSQRNIDSQPPHSYSSQHIAQNQQRRESLPFGRSMLNNDRYVPELPRKHDPQHTYPGYRPPLAPSQPGSRTESQYQPKYTTLEPMSHNMAKSQGRTPMPTQHTSQQDVMYISAASHPDYLNRTVDIRNSYSYMSSSTTQSGMRYIPNVQANGAQTTVTPRTAARGVQSSSKPRLEYPTSSHVPVPSRTTSKPPLTNQQQSRMTVSVSTLVDQMNQIKQQKRESPLDLSVKTVKNSADSSTTQEDVVDSLSLESKSLSLQQRPLSNNRHMHHTSVNSHKVEFTPNFNTYGGRDRNTSLVYPSTPQQAPPPTRHNGAYDILRSPAESFTAESRYSLYSDRNKQKIPVGKSEFFSNHKIDLTKSVAEERYPDKRIYDDRNFIIERRKRQRGPIVSNIPEKIYRTELASARHIDHITKSAREQRELMKQPVFSYTHQRNETYQNEQKNLIHQNMYRDHRHHHHQPNNYNYAYSNEQHSRESSSYHPCYPEKSLSNSSRPVIQTLSNHRDAHIHHNIDSRNGIPIEKSVKSLLRSSLESKQTGNVEPVRPTKEIPDLIVIDDGDDAVIEITDENETEVDTRNVAKSVANQTNPVLSHQIQMPKAIDSISEYPKFDSADQNKSPENDVASRIRTKAELKVMPPSQDNGIKPKNRQDLPLENVKLLPKSQKQHIFNQIREDFRLESVIKSEKVSESITCEVKSEPMNIDEIEKDAALSLKTENNHLNNLEPNRIDMSTDVEDLDFATALESFVEQLKLGCHKKKARKKRIDTSEQESDAKVIKTENDSQIEIESIPIQTVVDTMPLAIVKQEPIDEAETNLENATTSITMPDIIFKNEPEQTLVEVKNEKEETRVNNDKLHKTNTQENTTPQVENLKSSSELSKNSLKNEAKETDTKKTVTKEELESTDDDEPLIKSKILKEKEKSERLKHQLLRDLSEKSAIVKLECCDADMNKNVRKSIDLISKDKEEKHNKLKTRKTSRSKGKSLSMENKNEKQKIDSSSDSDDDNLSVASRLRFRKNTKNDENKTSGKPPAKSSPSKKSETNSTSTNSTPTRKPGFGDGSDFHPGWEEELYRYKRSLRMPTRLIAIPRGRSGGPFVKGSNTLFTRGSTSLPDLDPTPLSPAPSSAPSAATDDLFTRRPDKLTIDSDLDSNSSCSVPIRLNYDSEASTSTVFSTSNVRKKGSSIVDVLIQKCGRKEDSKKKPKEKDKDEHTSKITPKIQATPSLSILKDGIKGNLSTKKENLIEEIQYNLGTFKKETITAYRKAFLNNTGSLINATEEFRPVALKSKKRRTENRILKQRASIKEVFGDERPASAPPSSCIEDNQQEIQLVEIKKEPEVKVKLKPKKNIKGKLQRRSSSIKDGLRSTKSLKRNDANGRLMRLKNRNNLIKSLASKRTKDVHGNKHKKEKTVPEETDTTKEIKEEIPGPPEGITKRRLKRLFARRKFSSGFDYIRKKKKIIRREETINIKVRRPAVKPNPESVHDIHKEIKSWFINKSIGETHLHRAARLGYMDCVAYCLEKLESDPSAKDNAGFTPLHVAAARGHVKIARLLLQYGADVSAAAQGGIRPLHEACENCHVEVIRLLLSYGADPLLGTYADQTPEELAEGPSALLLRLHIADVQGHSVEPWRFPPLSEITDSEEFGCFPLCSPPPASPLPTLDSALEFQCSEAPLPPFYSLRAVPGQPADGLWCLLQDINNLLQIKSKESLLKQIHCGSGSPKELVQEIRTQEFLERAQCHQLMCAGEKVNVRASKVALVRVTDKLRQLLKMETVLVS